MNFRRNRWLARAPVLFAVVACSPETSSQSADARLHETQDGGRLSCDEQWRSLEAEWEEAIERLQLCEDTTDCQLVLTFQVDSDYRFCPSECRFVSINGRAEFSAVEKKFRDQCFGFEDPCAYDESNYRHCDFDIMKAICVAGKCEAIEARFLADAGAP